MAHNRKISIVGLGYVGLPMAVEFGYQQRVIALDINEKRIEQLKQGIDLTKEVDSEALKSSDLFFSSNPKDLQQADFHIVAVPTPVNQAKQPDMGIVYAASKTVGNQLKKGDIVVYESTVYPGATEEECVPILEKCSGLMAGKDFFVGYSPERINPGDKEHTFKTIQKVVSGQNEEVLDLIAAVYSSVIPAGVYRASSIKVAEAAKVIENTQRDLNIALINELALIFDKLGIDTVDVLQAAGSKWNFLNFRPGLVGGHCIGVDPYYLTHKAQKIGVQPRVILAGRGINDGMGAYVAQQTIKQLANLHKPVSHAKVGILGLAFKENCPDLRNTKVLDIVRELKQYGIEPIINDPVVDAEDAKKKYGIDLILFDEMKELDVMIVAVPHKIYLEKSLDNLLSKLTEPKLLIDVKSVFDRAELTKRNVKVWRL